MDSNVIQSLQAQRMVFSHSQVKSIRALIIPHRITFLSADKYDDKYIDTTTDKWKCHYSGSNIYLTFKFDDKETKILAKFLCSKWMSENQPNSCEHVLYALLDLFKYLSESDLNLSKKNTIEYLHTLYCEPHKFYKTIYLLRKLGEINFPLIGEDIEGSLLYIPRPQTNSFLVYQELDDNIIPQRILTFIAQGFLKILEHSLIEPKVLHDASVLGLVYTAGLRPVQLDKLEVKDIFRDTEVDENGFSRYSIMIPYAKQGKLTNDSERIKVDLPNEIGSVIFRYIKAYKLNPYDKLFARTCCTISLVNSSINNQILRFSPLDYQKLVANNEVIQIKITSTQFRHNIGHSLAYRGASADEISAVLGHATEISARHYILATPELARIRYKALGVNEAWQSMMSLVVTGDITNESDWTGKKVAGFVGGKLHHSIGGCARLSTSCPFSPVRSCYGCMYFRPFINKHHVEVLVSIIQELTDLMVISEATGQPRSPLLKELVFMKENVIHLVKRIDKWENKS